TPGPPRRMSIMGLLILVGALGLIGPLAGGMATAGQSLVAQAAPIEPAPGVAAPSGGAREPHAALVAAVKRFEAKDTEGVLAYVSDRYRTGLFTKSVVRDHLIGLYSVYDMVRARVRIDDVRLVGEHAWVYSTGEISGQLPLVRSWVRFLSWQRELEVARREAGGWRLFGYQQ